MVRTDYSLIDDSITWKLKNKYSITQKNGMTNNNKTMRIISGNCLKIMHPTIGVDKLNQYYSKNIWSHQQLLGCITNQKKLVKKLPKHVFPWSHRTLSVPIQPYFSRWTATTTQDDSSISILLIIPSIPWLYWVKIAWSIQNWYRIIFYPKFGKSIHTAMEVDTILGWHPN